MWESFLTFLDHLATDVKQLERLNQLLSEGHIRQTGPEGCEGIRPPKTCLVAPSVDYQNWQHNIEREMPYLIQYFVSGLGRDAASCSDLMSYLLFTPKYTIDIGYNDADKRIDEIENFLYSPQEDDEGPPTGPIGAGKTRQIGSLAKRVPNLVKSRG